MGIFVVVSPHRMLKYKVLPPGGAAALLAAASAVAAASSEAGFAIAGSTFGDASPSSADRKHRKPRSKMIQVYVARSVIIVGCHTARLARDIKHCTLEKVHAHDE